MDKTELQKMLPTIIRVVTIIGTPILLYYVMGFIGILVSFVIIGILGKIFDRQNKEEKEEKTKKKTN